jgi:uncharacterized protein YjlB
MKKSTTLKKPEHYLIDGDNEFPNNDYLPVLIYKQAFSSQEKKLAEVIEETFNKNNWTNSWRNGILEKHHYHSNTHEALGISAGHCKVQLGGPNGIILDVEKGDVVVLPAGIAHKNLNCSKDFEVVGGYPGGIEHDMKYGKPGERPTADENIRKVSLPETDPIYGYEGALITFWMIQ